MFSGDMERDQRHEMAEWHFTQEIISKFGLNLSGSERIDLLNCNVIDGKSSNVKTSFSRIELPVSMGKFNHNIITPISTQDKFGYLIVS